MSFYIIANASGTTTFQQGGLAPKGAEEVSQSAWLDAQTAAMSAPVAPTVPPSVSRRQFFQAAAQSGLITKPDALAIFTTGAIPANLAAALATMPAADQFAAEIAILGNESFERANPLVAELGAAMSQTPAQIDDLFTLAAGL